MKENKKKRRGKIKTERMGEGEKLLEIEWDGA